MSQKNRKKNRLEIKREQVLKQSKPKLNPIYILLTAGFLVCVVVIAFILTDAKRPYPPSSSQAVYQNISSGKVAYPVSMFQDGAAHFFEYRSGDMTIRYFILKSSDGLLRAAFDACDVCWPAGKGYAQQGDEMVCRNCGRRFASIRINEVKGGCNPAPLNRTVEADQLVINTSDILQGRSYFNFKERV